MQDVLSETLRLQLPDGPIYLQAAAAETIVDEIWQQNVYHVHDMEGGTVLDIGAHQGIFARYALRRGAARVVAVEPDPDCAALLRRNTEGRGVHVIERALHYEGDAVTLVHPTGGESPFLEAPERRTEGRRIEVKTTTLKVLLQDLGEVAFCKIDCEGAEYQIGFREVPGVFAPCRYVSIETHRATPEAWGYLLTCLAATHTLTTLGDPTMEGAYVWATRYNL